MNLRAVPGYSSLPKIVIDKSERSLSFSTMSTQYAFSSDGHYSEIESVMR